MLIIYIRYILPRRSLALNITAYINKGFPGHQETIIFFIHIYILEPSYFYQSIIRYVSSNWPIEPDCKYTIIGPALLQYTYWLWYPTTPIAYSNCKSSNLMFFFLYSLIIWDRIVISNSETSTPLSNIHYIINYKVNQRTYNIIN